MQRKNKLENCYEQKKVPCSDWGVSSTAFKD